MYPVRKLTRSWIASSLLAIGLSLCVRQTDAEERTSAERGLAETLFKDGRELMDAQRYQEACAKFAESQRLDPGGGTLLNLAVCHEKLGRLATAWAEYREALAIARVDQRDDRIELAQQRIAALEPELPRLTVKVAPAARVPELAVVLDEAALRSASWGVAFPVDPGKHVLSAKAPGKKPWSVAVTLEARAQREIEVPALRAESQTEDHASQPTNTRRRTIGYGVGGIGVAALLVGGYFGIEAIKKRGDSNDECPNERCTDEGVRLNDAAKRDANVANVGIGVGLIGIGIGTYLIVTSDAGEGRSPATAWRASVSPVSRGGALSVAGSF